jgi:hypothetical protein
MGRHDEPMVSRLATEPGTRSRRGIVAAMIGGLALMIMGGCPDFVGASSVPSVAIPTEGQQFLSGSPVPIRLIPPQSGTTKLFSVEILYRYAPGQWRLVTRIPVGVQAATSPTGYVGWGTGGSDGKSLAFMAQPGIYRLRAQVSSPQESGWSDWRGFEVTSTKNRLTKPPRSFGK